MIKTWTFKNILTNLPAAENPIITSYKDSRDILELIENVLKNYKFGPVNHR
mgnify:CR=1 FL=1